MAAYINGSNTVYLVFSGSFSENEISDCNLMRIKRRARTYANLLTFISVHVSEYGVLRTCDSMRAWMTGGALMKH